MDHFVQSVGTDAGEHESGRRPVLARHVMDYYDGNTVTGLWNYAQHYAMSDNSFGTTFGPSAPGAINLASGDTGDVDTTHTANNPSVSTSTSPDGDITPDGKGGYSLTSDAQPYWDDCSTRDAVAMNGKNIGDVLNAAGLSWGWFEGGFRPTTTFAGGVAATGHSGQSTATFIPDEFKGAELPEQRCRTRRQPGRSATRCTRSAWLSAAPASRATRTTTSRTTSRSSTTPRPPTRTT